MLLTKDCVGTTCKTVVLCTYMIYVLNNNHNNNNNNNNTNNTNNNPHHNNGCQSHETITAS